MADDRTYTDEQVALLAQFPSPDGISGDQTRPYYKNQIVACLVVCLSPLTMGMVLGYSSPTTPQLQAAKILTSAESVSWFGSLATVGAILGGPIAGPLVAQLGRKVSLVCGCVPYVVGWFMLAYGTDVGLLYTGRVVTGVGMGMTCMCANIYIAEVTSKELRGALSGCFQLAVTVGILLTYVLGNYLNWHWLAVVGLAPSVLMVFMMLLLPETPHWFLSRHQRSSAIDSLIWLRGTSVNVEEECSEIEENISIQEQQQMRLAEFRKPELYRPLLVSLGIMVFQQFSGVNAVVFYLLSIFKSAGYKGDGALPSIVMGVVQMVSTGISCLLMDRAGRRVLLLVAGAFMALSATTLGLYYYLTTHNPDLNIGWLSLASLSIYIFGFSIGWGPIPWVVMGEIFPSRAKGLSSSVATLLNWSCAFLVTKEFHALVEGLYIYGAFWLFAGMCFLGVIFVAVFLPETKGKSLEQIEQYFGVLRNIDLQVE